MGQTIRSNRVQRLVDRKPFGVGGRIDSCHGFVMSRSDNCVANDNNGTHRQLTPIAGHSGEIQRSPHPPEV